jgi:hypothetical protein
LEQVVREKGRIILVIDAVDEISLDGNGLQFLPDPLPIGVSALLSARESRVVKWLENNRDVDVIRLKEFEKSEIPLFTNMRNEDGEMQSRFNERVWKASGGWPLMVLEASKLAQTNPADLDQIQIDRSKDGLFERRVNEWRSTSINNLPNALLDILKLLSIFESVAPVDLDLIQPTFRTPFLQPDPISEVFCLGERTDRKSDGFTEFSGSETHKKVAQR